MRSELENIWEQVAMQICPEKKKKDCMSSVRLSSRVSNLGSPKYEL
jgi:hypothetical protein